MQSDSLFFKPVQDSVDLISEYSDHPVFYYEYAHEGQFSLTKIFGPSADKLKGNKLMLF